MSAPIQWQEKIAELYSLEDMSAEELADLEHSLRYKCSSPVIVEGKLSRCAQSELAGVLQEYARINFETREFFQDCCYIGTPERIAATLPALWEWHAVGQKAFIDTVRAGIAQANQMGVTLERVMYPYGWGEFAPDGYKALGLNCCPQSGGRDTFTFYSERKYGRFFDVPAPPAP